MVEPSGFRIDGAGRSANESEHPVDDEATAGKVRLAVRAIVEAVASGHPPHHPLIGNDAFVGDGVTPGPSRADVRQATDTARRRWDPAPMQQSSFRKSIRPGPGAWAALFWTIALSAVAMPSHATEEPEYQVVRELEGIEVRQYAAYAVAEVVVAGPAGDAGNQAFPILAGYIFGKNRGERKFEMTAPVTQAAVPVKLEMTAPVTQTAAPGGFLVQFVLPRGVTAATAPAPLDARVQLREVLPGRVAVIRYSGFWSASNDNTHLAKLQAALRAAGVAWTGEAVYSRYNAPYTPWFMRRNEIWLQLAPGG